MGYNLKLVEPPTERIVSTEIMKRHLNVEADNTEDDELIEEYIDSATSLLEGKDGILRRALAPQTWMMVFDEWPDGPFRVPLPPLIEVLEVAYVDEDGNRLVLDPDADDGYRVDTVSEPGWISPRGSWPATLETVNAVEVTFRAGYVQGEGTSNPPYPPTLRQLVREITASMYENRGNASWSMPDPLAEKANLYKVYYP